MVVFWLIIQLFAYQITYTIQKQLSLPPAINQPSFDIKPYGPPKNTRMKLSIETDTGPLVVPCRTTISISPTISLKTSSPIRPISPLKNSALTLPFTEDLSSLTASNPSNLAPSAKPSLRLIKNSSSLIDGPTPIFFQEPSAPSIETLTKIAPIVTSTPKYESPFAFPRPEVAITNKLVVIPATNEAIVQGDQARFSNIYNVKPPLIRQKQVESSSIVMNTLETCPMMKTGIPIYKHYIEQNCHVPIADKIEVIESSLNTNILPTNSLLMDPITIGDQLLHTVQKVPQILAPSKQEPLANTIALAACNNSQMSSNNKPLTSDTFYYVDLSESRQKLPAATIDEINLDPQSNLKLLKNSKENSIGSLHKSFHPEVLQPGTNIKQDFKINREKNINEQIYKDSLLASKGSSSNDSISPGNKQQIRISITQKFLPDLSSTDILPCNEQNQPVCSHSKPLSCLIPDPETPLYQYKMTNNNIENSDKIAEQEDLAKVTKIKDHSNYISPIKTCDNKSFTICTQNTQSNENMISGIDSSAHFSIQDSLNNYPRLCDVSPLTPLVPLPRPSSNTQAIPFTDLFNINTLPENSENSYVLEKETLYSSSTTLLDPLDTDIITSSKIDKSPVFVSDQAIHSITPETCWLPSENYIPSFNLNSPLVKTPSYLPEPVVKNLSNYESYNKGISTSLPLSETISSSSSNSLSKSNFPPTITTPITSITINIIPSPQESPSEIIIII